MQPLGLQSFWRREGAGETLSAQASHKHQGAHYTLTTPAFSVVPKIPTRLCGGPGLERSRFSQCQIGRSRSPLSRGLQRFAFSPGGLGCGGSELGRTGDRPLAAGTCAPAASSFLLWCRGGALQGGDHPWSWSALAGASLGEPVPGPMQALNPGKAALFCLAQEL